MRKMYWEELPKWKNGQCKGKIDWVNCIGLKCKFIYDDIEGYVNIVDYNKKGQILSLTYLNDDIFKSATLSFKNCAIGYIMGTYNKHYIYNIGDVVNNLKIIEQGHNKKERIYKFECLICGFKCEENYKGENYYEEHWISENHLKNGNSCGCCKNKITIPNINSMWKTDYWMVELGVDEEFAKTHTKGSNKKCKVICPDCGREDLKIPTNVYIRKSIGCMCNVGYYTEKFMSSVLFQLDLNFKMQLSKTTFNWCKNYKYDFYFEYNNEQYITETHGGQHYTRDSSFKNGQTLLQIQENDRLKKELALANGIKEENYIVIDCRKSELEFIKDNILNSRLNDLFDLSKIDWLKVEEFSLSNISKKVCDIYNENPKLSSKEIGLMFGVGSSLIVTWLNKWANIGMCSYDGKEVMRTRVYNREDVGKCSRKEVEVFKDGESKGIFISCADVERQSLELFGIQMRQDNISAVANGDRKHHRNHTFKYTA